MVVMDHSFCLLTSRLNGGFWSSLYNTESFMKRIVNQLIRSSTFFLVRFNPAVVFRGSTY